MTFLPVVERELRVAARRSSTYRFRVWVVGAAVAVAGVLWWPTVVANAVGVAFPGTGFSGRTLFSTLSGLLLILCLVEGSRSTAGAISEERSEGTLALLFLTELSSYDLVLGKWVGRALRPLFALLAVLPVLSLSVPMGGVSGGEFWRTALALLGTVCFSLSLGLAVSALSANGQRALLWSLGAMAFVSVLPLLAGEVLRAIGSPTFARFVSVTSPIAAFIASPDLRYARAKGDFWVPWSFCLAASALMLGFAAWATARAWQERSTTTAVATRFGRMRFVLPLLPLAAVRRRKGGAHASPAVWLFHEPQREWWLLRLALVAGGAFLLVGVISGPALPTTVTYAVTFGLAWAVRVGVVAQACHALVTARRCGLLELVLTTPLSGPDLLRGHHRATLFTWLGPALLPFGLSLLGAGTAYAAHRPTVRPIEEALPGIVENLVLLLDLPTLFWTGTWFSLREGRANAAAIKALVLTQIVPAFLCCGLLRVLTDLLFLAWTRRRALDQCRIALQQLPTPALM
jgi:hypothetical protein